MNLVLSSQLQRVFLVLSSQLQRVFQSLLTGGIAVMILWSCAGPAGPDGDDASLPDSLPPYIEWIQPEGDVEVESSLLMQVRAFDRRGREDGSIYDTLAWKVSFFINGDEFPASLVDSAGYLYEFFWDASLYPPAPYPLLARAQDNERNQADTQTIIAWVRN